MFVACVSLALNQEKAPYHLETWKILSPDIQVDKIIRFMNTAEPGIAIGILKDNRLMWTDTRVTGSAPIREGKLTEFPNYAPSGQQKIDDENARKLAETMFGTSDPHPLQGIGMYPYDQHRQFCLTNFHDQFYFYESSTGKLLRKVRLEKTGNYSRWGLQFSPDGKMVLTGAASLSKMYVHSLETGKLVLEVKRSIFDQVSLMPDNKRVIKMSGNTVSFFSVNTGKELPEKITLAQGMTGEMIVNPTGKSFAYQTYTKDGKKNGSYIYSFADKKATRIDPRSDNVYPFAYSPGGKWLIMYEAKWLYFIDPEKGTILFVVEAAPHAMWDYLYSGLDISEDNKILLVAPDAADNHLRYGVACFLDSEPVKPVTIFGPTKSGIGF